MREHVFRAQARLQPGRDFGKEEVSHIVAQCIVNQLELVQVQKDHGKRDPLPSRRLFAVLLKMCYEVLPIRQAGEQVVGRCVVQDARLLLGVSSCAIRQHGRLLGGNQCLLERVFSRSS